VNDGDPAPGPTQRGDLGRRVRWEQDSRGRFLVFDCSNNTLEEAYALFDAFHDAVMAEPAGSVRVLADFENAAHEPKLTRRWKSAWQVHNGQVRILACLGVTGGIKVVIAAYRFYARLRGTDLDARMRFFDREEEARAWLASH
jgi:SpoIIAA-like